MATQLVEMKEGVVIEVQISTDQTQPISGGLPKHVDAAIDSLKPLIRTACEPIVSVWGELNKDLSVTQTQVEFIPITVRFYRFNADKIKSKLVREAASGGFKFQVHYGG